MRCLQQLNLDLIEQSLFLLRPPSMEFMIGQLNQGLIGCTEGYILRSSMHWKILYREF